MSGFARSSSGLSSPDCRFSTKWPHSEAHCAERLHVFQLFLSQLHDFTSILEKPLLPTSPHPSPPASLPGCFHCKVQGKLYTPPQPLSGYCKGQCPFRGSRPGGRRTARQCRIPCLDQGLTYAFQTASGGSQTHLTNPRRKASQTLSLPQETKELKSLLLEILKYRGKATLLEPGRVAPQWNVSWGPATL